MLQGHYWTIRSHFENRLTPPKLPASQAWFCDVEDDLLGPVRLSGRLRVVPGSDSLLVIVHGLGGSSQSNYTFHAAAAAEAAGLCSLRLNLRGADLRGEDLFHGGLGADIDAALASPSLRHFRTVLLLGYSMGGHVSLCAAANSRDPRLKAVAALCSPLDLATSSRAFDTPGCTVYRRHVLDGLKAMYRSFLARRPRHAPAPLSRIAQVTHIREWDQLVVAPRFGFASVDDYYATQSASRCMAQIQLPCLLLHSTLDPMVPLHSVQPFYSRASKTTEVMELRSGGHVAFPTRLSLGFGAPGRLEPQILHWLMERAAG